MWADRCAEAWERGGSKLQQAVGTRIRGLVAGQREDYSSTESLYRDALALFRNLKDDEWTAIILNDLGAFEYNRDNYDAAEQYYQGALEIATKQDDKEGQAIFTGNLGALAFERKQWADSRKLYEQALALMQEVGRQNEIARIKRGLAGVYEAEQRVDLALQLAQEALKIYERLQHKNLAEAREFVERLKKDEG